jgi:23S rRNA pseudouridine1911/1915/1917 synthase
VILRVEAEEAGGRLDRFLADRLPGQSRSLLQRCIADGRVTVGGQPLRQASRRLGAGEVVTLDLPVLVTVGPPEPDPAVAFTVLYSDEALIVVDKPAGLVVHPGAGPERGTLVNGLLARFADLGPAFFLAVDPAAAEDGEAGGDAEALAAELARPGIVHRLDRDTSGVMVVARGPQAAAALRAQFQARSVEKRYLALVRGKLSAAEGLIDAPIGRHPGMRQRMAVLSGGREAQTRYRVLLEWPGISWIEAFPRTGRTHQIRVHLASIGHPVLSDPVYGLPDPRIGRQALHASRISLDHPQSGERLSFEAPLPADLAAALEGLGLPEG